VRYSVLLPPVDSSIWKILDERGDVVFAGDKQQCEEWLDLADFSETLAGRPTEQILGGVTNRVTGGISNRLPIFELATALLRRF